MRGMDRQRIQATSIINKADLSSGLLDFIFRVSLEERKGRRTDQPQIRSWVLIISVLMGGDEGVGSRSKSDITLWRLTGALENEAKESVTKTKTQTAKADGF